MGATHMQEPSKMAAGAEYVRWGYVLIVGAFFLYAAYNISPFVILAPYIAMLAEPTVEQWAKRFNSRATAVKLMIGCLFGVVISLSVVVVLLSVPLTRLAHQFPEFVQVFLPQAQKLLDDLESQLKAYDIFGKDFDVALSSLVQIFSKMFTEGGSAVPKLLGYVLTPFILVAEGLIVLVLAAFFLAYWPGFWQGVKSQFQTYLPAAWPWTKEISEEMQTVGRNVAWGYIVVVCILTPIIFVAFVGVGLFNAALTGSILVNLAVTSLCLAFVSAMPGVGAKAGLALIVAVGLFTFGWSLANLISLVIIGLAITTLESKYFTLKFIGKALGLNSAVILLIALSSILLGGVSGALWTLFFGLPLIIAANRVYTRHANKTEQPAEA